MEYSDVSQPPVTFCSFIHRGTVSSIITPQITRVFPIATSTEPLACGAMFKSKLIERIWSDARPSLRCMSATLNVSEKKAKILCRPSHLRPFLHWDEIVSQADACVSPLKIATCGAKISCQNLANER